MIRPSAYGQSRDGVPEFITEQAVTVKDCGKFFHKISVLGFGTSLNVIRLTIIGL